MEYFSEHEGYRCGYCKSEDTNYSHGMWAHVLTVQDYQVYYRRSSVQDKSFNGSDSHCLFFYCKLFPWSLTTVSREVFSLTSIKMEFC